jgi:hypothetical protein
MTYDLRFGIWNKYIYVPRYTRPTTPFNPSYESALRRYRAIAYKSYVVQGSEPQRDLTWVPTYLYMSYRPMQGGWPGAYTVRRTTLGDGPYLPKL